MIGFVEIYRFVSEVHIEMRFELDHMMSFTKVDPRSNSKMKRGLALTWIGLDPADQSHDV